MIFIKNDIFGKVWKVMEKTDKYMDIQMSTSEKNVDGEYVNSSWFPRLIGHAYNSLKDAIKDGDRIIIKKSKLTNERYKDNEGAYKSRFRFLILEAELEHKSQQENADVPAQSAIDEAEAKSAKDDCPW